MSFGGWSAPSEEDLASGGDYTSLPEDEYIAKVVSIELKHDVQNNFPSKNDPGPTHNMLVLKAQVLTFADGEPLVDTEENPVDEPVDFQSWLNPAKRGMIPQPSQTRKAFAAILGQSIGDPIDISSFGELAGKTFIVSLKNEKGYNNAKDYRPIKRSRSRGTTTKGPVDGGELMERAKEIFDEDSPTNTSPTPSAARSSRKKSGDTVVELQSNDDLDF